MDKVALIPAVEQLLKAINNEEVLDDVVQGVKDALGYDPTLVEQDYLVKLEMEVYATTPKGAVKEFFKMMSDESLCLEDWVYRVIDENGNETLIDGWSLSK